MSTMRLLVFGADGHNSSHPLVWQLYTYWLFNDHVTQRHGGCLVGVARLSYRKYLNIHVLGGMEAVKDRERHDSGGKSGLCIAISP